MNMLCTSCNQLLRRRVYQCQISFFRCPVCGRMRKRLINYAYIHGALSRPDGETWNETLWDARIGHADCNQLLLLHLR